ncbi:MAG: histidine triad nucleotide-binding protein [Gemmatimonadaceae bacterium]|nr:histidine triad nucleotide-binding protein [Gemmatimonadaceae bacterium]NUO96104.1 histidine triad nucleotide-binding protein [Gemmatimonadaceae bacterium]NUP56358.1 histidine triad nucleotide-binding protein [Gemmatimonadaceae bacterium]NUP73011.1 histidine triad nucleotide-binding protein [Gemmatimonadaceae bacterium]NUR32621.1 histidine triad nucleotide-binding protein [Gemmatimonadaceae bacterium]
MSATDTCLFCRIVRREIPATIVWENAHALAFRDIKPESPTHLLVVPKRHVGSLNDATDAQLLGELLLAAREIAEGEGIAQSGYRTVVNTGRDAGQTVFHLHVHVLGGRHMKWPPG